jgi:hypothetical protein
MQRNYKDEHGITLPLVAICLFVILGMAALAIDVVSLYVARTEAQRAADAAGLAAAKAMVDTGFTSGLALTPTDVCSGGPASAANQEATKAAAQNMIAGQAGAVQSLACNLSNPQNPRVTVTIQRTGLPTFFSRIWGNTGNSVTATATAEAFNPSGQTGAPPISVASVKPFLIPNCNPGGGPGFPCTAFFFSGPGNALNAPSAYIDIVPPFTFNQGKVNPGSGANANEYLVVDMSSMPAIGCPSTAALPSGSCSRAGNGGLYDAIACANTNAIKCGDPLTVHAMTGMGNDRPDAAQGTQCLIHSSGATAVACTSPNTTYDQDCFIPGPPTMATTIQGGISNPNPLLRSKPNISRSDSIVTVPVYDGTNNPCPGGTCGPVTVIGFLQLGVQEVDTNGNFKAYVLNAAGCGSSTGTPISGGGVSPIPVRLVHN